MQWQQLEYQCLKQVYKGILFVDVDHWNESENRILKQICLREGIDLYWIQLAQNTVQWQTIEKRWLTCWFHKRLVISWRTKRQRPISSGVWTSCTSVFADALVRFTIPDDHVFLSKYVVLVRLSILSALIEFVHWDGLFYSKQRSMSPWCSDFRPFDFVTSLLLINYLSQTPCW